MICDVKEICFYPKNWLTLLPLFKMFLLIKIVKIWILMCRFFRCNIQGSQSLWKQQIIKNLEVNLNFVIVNRRP